ncbi:MAG TPA: ribosomal protein S18-alanine N-acetyltransferase [Rudaea sp.]|nr:ribosomal protein S18-alanine N-acetyltransferase [Rudaea sp.]
MVAILKEPYPALRTMSADDLEQVAAIELSAYEYPWTHGIFRDCLRAGYDCIVLAHGIEVVGYGVLSAAAGEAHVLNVCVAPTQQGQGHGKRLMKRLIDLARWHRAERIFLEVRPSNAHAVRLYYQLGFNEIGKRPNYYPSKRGREDAVVMAMELLPPEAPE